VEPASKAKRHAAGVPEQLWRRPVRVVRPRDANGIYSDPSEQFGRLTRRGLLLRLAPGYFALVPPDRVGSNPPWVPPLADAGWAIAAADYGVDAVALCGSSAARHHGLIPRAMAVAYVATPKQRPRLHVTDGEVRYSRRDVTALDVERIRTQLGDGWVTTLEQTALDLLARPDRWKLPSEDLEQAVGATRSRLDIQLVTELAGRQHRPSALARLLDLTG
jgi:predicted transcriptional regulator of viral defense system